MAKAKAKELKEAPVLRSGGGGDESLPIDRIIVRGKTCTADVILNMNDGIVAGVVSFNGASYRFAAQLGE